MSSQNVKESLCVRMLRCLDHQQQKGFDAYLRCSLFNTNESLVKVYHCLREKTIDSSKPDISPQELFAGTDINPGLFAKYASQLVAHLERFVPFWEQKDDPRHGYADAFTAWERMGLDQDLLERQYRKMKRKADKLPPSEWKLFHAFELEHRYLQYKASHPRKDQAPLFEAAEAALDDLYQVSKIRYYCARRSMGGFLASADSVESVLSSGKLEFEQLPLLGQAYFRAAAQLETENLSLEEATEFYQWIQKNQHKFSTEDREDLFGFLLNICIKNFIKGLEFGDLLDRVYMEMAAEKLLNNENLLPGSHFKNIVSIKIKLGHLEAASVFIDQYQFELGDEDRKEVVPYTRGLVAYHQGSFRTAVTYFQTVLDSQPKDVYWGLEARLMLWRSYYEVLELMDHEEYEEFLRQYDSMRIYISRRSYLDTQQKVGYENFIRIFNRLARLKESPASIKELEALKEEVLELDTIKQRTWLCQVIDRQLASIEAK